MADKKTKNDKGPRVPKVIEPTLFVAWDTTTEGLANTLKRVDGERIAGRRVHVPGLKPFQGSIPKDAVLKPLHDASAALVMLDRPNANVGFELGLALGWERPVSLAVHGTRASWLQKPPLSGRSAPSVDNAPALRKLIEGLEPQVGPGRPKLGSDVLVLCPTRSQGANCLEEVSKAMPRHWRVFDSAELWTLDDLPRLLKGCGTVIWLYVPAENPETERDGDDNAAFGVLAGYAKAAGCSFLFWHYGTESDDRLVADTAEERRFFTDTDLLPGFIDFADRARGQREYASKLAAYRAGAAKRFESHKPLGFEGRQRLELVFDDLAIELPCADIAGAAPGRRGRVFRDGAEAAQLAGAGGGDRFSVVEAFDPARVGPDRRGVVLLGDPGSGKTTQLRRLVRWLCVDGDGSGPPRGALTGYLPFFVALRDLPAKTLTRELTADRLIRHACEKAGIDGDEAFRALLLKQEKILFLIDGLDEVGELADRAKAAKALQKLPQAGPHVRVLATCRFSGYAKEAKFSAKTFAELHLPPMNGELAERFVENWYAAVETAGEVANRPEALANASRKAAALNDLIRSGNIAAKRIRDMTGNPLLLTAICLVHRDRKTLPEGRAELYDLCVKVLLELWWKERAGDKDAKLRMECARSERVLMALAWWMHAESGRTGATAEQLRVPLKKALTRVKWPDSADDFLKWIRDDTGLLTGWGSDYRFLHLGFQEFLWARELARTAANRSGRMRRLAGRLTESWWQEPAALFLALPHTNFSRKFFRQLVKMPAFGDRRHESVLLDIVAAAHEPDTRVFRGLLAEAREVKKPDWAKVRTAAALLKKIDAKAWAREKSRFAKADPSDPEIRIHFGLDTVPAEAKSVPAGASGPPGSNSGGPSELKTNNGGVELVRIPAGRFWMGAADDESEALPTERPRRLVTLTQDFYLGRYAVTNAEFAAFMEAVKGDPAYEFKEPDLWRDKKFNGERQPVVGVDYDTARLFCRWAGADGAAGFVGELPTEAQWEYACRAGTEGRFWSETAKDKDPKAALDRVGWFDKNSEGRLHVVGEKPPNQLGLYDMHGNVLEWCRDYFGFYAAADSSDPDFQDEVRSRADTTKRRRDIGKEVKPDDEWAARVLRGGSWGLVASRCRSAARNWSLPGFRLSSLGFRLALSAPRAQ